MNRKIIAGIAIIVIIMVAVAKPNKIEQCTKACAGGDYSIKAARESHRQSCVMAQFAGGSEGLQSKTNQCLKIRP